MFKVLMPRLDPGMKDGIVIEWLKEEGDRLQKGEALVSIEGEKAVFDIEVQTSGILTKKLAEEHTVVPVGEVIAIITEEGEKAPEEEKSFEKPREEKVPATPAAKRIAKERGIDLTELTGSGPDGMILERDLLHKIGANSLEAQKPGAPVEPENDEIIPLTGMRKTIAERLTDSYRTAPHVAITMEVDMSRALVLQRELSEAQGMKIPITALLANITAKALKDNPVMNSVFENDQIRVVKDINVGIAVGIEDGLIVPVLHNVDKKSLSETARKIRDLIDKAKTRSLSVEELRGGTFTITNLGSFGVEIFTPIINPPQAAILGVGRIADKPIVLYNEVRIAPMMTLTLVFDHRIVDGAKAAQFLGRIKEYLEKT